MRHLTLTAPWALAALLALGAQARLSHAADAVTEITTANAAGKTVFLVVTDGGQGREAARQAADAASQLVPGTTVLELDRKDPAQEKAVAGYRLAAAPVPLVLVVATNGVAVGGQRPGDGAAAKLVALVPTPKKAEYLKHLAEGRTALLAFTHAQQAEREGLWNGANEAVKLLEGKAALVLIDTTDVAEKRFLEQMKVPADAAKPVLIVMNPKAQVLGRLEGAQPAAKIVETAKKKAPCCGDPGCKGCGG
jgi:ribosomal protein L7Ae-like RNA K-turn-binding protein